MSKKKLRRRVRALEGRVFAAEDAGRETWERVEALEGELRAEKHERETLIANILDAAVKADSRIDSLAGSVDMLASAVREVQRHTPYPAEVDGLIDHVKMLEKRIGRLESLME